MNSLVTGPRAAADMCGVSLDILDLVELLSDSLPPFKRLMTAFT